MLYHYLDHKRKESSAPLHATYLVTGKFVDNGQTVSYMTYLDLLYDYLHMQAFHLIWDVHDVVSESQGVSCQRGPTGRCVN